MSVSLRPIMSRPAAIYGIVGIACLVAAGPPSNALPNDLIRRANAAYLADNREEAERLYTAAEERTSDPGLIAFNRAALMFGKGEFREAELLYDRVLSDAAIPPERAARARYNRGTCLLRRGGPSALFQVAIDDFERCLDSPASDEVLKANSRHNLELAKLLWKRAWDEEVSAGKKPPPPSEQAPPERQPESRQPQPNEQTSNTPGSANPGGTKPQTEPPLKQVENPLTTHNNADSPNRGMNTTAPELKNEDAVQILSPEDTRNLLRRTAERLKKDRHALLETLYPKYKPGARDW
jgi:tetratricopeptide (TPR) repeat protein